jgi:hypothetical protein
MTPLVEACALILRSTTRRTFEDTFDKPVAIVARTDLPTRLHDSIERPATSAAPSR